MSTQKHITFVINDFTVGGAQKLFIQLANRFVADGYTVDFISLVILPGKADLLHEVSPQIAVTRLQFSGTLDVRGWWQLLQLLMKHRGPVFSTLFLANLTTRILQLFHWRKVIVVEQNTYDTKKSLFIFLDWLLAYVTQSIICTSQSVATFTQKQEHISASKFLVIHSGVDVEGLQSIIAPNDKETLRKEFDISLDTIWFLNVARLAEQKSQDTLIQGFDIFLKTKSENSRGVYKLVIVGEGKERRNLEKLIHALHLQDVVTLAGVRKDVARFYNAADVFVSSSRIEGFSIVHAEAMAFGLPIVTTRTAGPDVMVKDGENGFFVDYTAESLATGLEKIVSGDRGAFSRSSLERVMLFTMDATYIEYRKVVEGK
jgi:glycosyltransferase involved in cell wall biosynthesis